MRSVPSQRIDDELLKEYLYRGKDDNNKAVPDTIAEGSYGECIYAKITEKCEKIYCNNRARSTTKLHNGTNTFAPQETHNLVVDKIREEMAQMRIELGLVLKHGSGADEYVNAVNYLTKSQPP